MEEREELMSEHEPLAAADASPAAKGANGMVTWLTGESAAMQAAKDIEYFKKQQDKAAGEPGNPLAIFGVIAAFLSAMFAGASASASIAGLVKNSKSSQDTVSTVEVEVNNLSSCSVVLAAYDANVDVDVTKAIDPLAPGGTDSLVVTRVGTMPSTARFSLKFNVGNGSDNISAILDYRRVQLSGPWAIGATVDGTTPLPSPNDQLQLLAVTFRAYPGTTAPSFSIYMQNIGYGTGKLSVTMYDLAPIGA